MLIMNDSINTLFHVDIGQYDVRYLAAILLLYFFMLIWDKILLVVNSSSINISFHVNIGKYDVSYLAAIL